MTKDNNSNEKKARRATVKFTLYKVQFIKLSFTICTLHFINQTFINFSSQNETGEGGGCSGSPTSLLQRYNFHRN